MADAEWWTLIGSLDSAVKRTFRESSAKIPRAKSIRRTLIVSIHSTLAGIVIAVQFAIFHAIHMLDCVAGVTEGTKPVKKGGVFMGFVVICFLF
mgnify:CR=1 FL=1